MCCGGIRARENGKDTYACTRVCTHTYTRMHVHTLRLLARIHTADEGFPAHPTHPRQCLHTHALTTRTHACAHPRCPCIHTSALASTHSHDARTNIHARTHIRTHIRMLAHTQALIRIRTHACSFTHACITHVRTHIHAQMGCTTASATLA